MVGPERGLDIMSQRWIN